SKLLSEDIENENSGLKPYRFAKTVEVNYNTNNSGKWDILENGDKIWRIGFYSEAALSLNVIFKKFIIPIGAKLFIYNENRTEILGAFTNKNQIPTGKLATSIINSNSIIVEYNEPKNSEFSGELEIYKVNHGYKSIESFVQEDTYDKSGACNVDINCTEGSAWQKEKRAVCKVLIGGTNICSGSLINNTLQDGTPFFLTANHCATQPYDEWIFYFNYEHSTCNSSNSSLNQSISGCQLKATSINIDFCLVQMSTNPPPIYQPYFAGWSLSTSATANSTCIHHPDGDVKKISKDYNPQTIANYGNGYDYNSHWLISQWDIGTTEGGSSGSPLFDANHRIIGSLTGGQAQCGNSIDDYFSRFDLAWNKYSSNSEQIKSWLDPNNSGFTSLNGFGPYSDFQCDTISNFTNSDNLTVYNFTDAWGYWTGQNEYGFKKFADRFYTSTTKNLNYINLPIFRAFSADSSNYITLKVWDNLNSKPNNELGSKDVLISEFMEGYWANIGFHSTISVIDTFYVGYEVYYNNPVDTFATFIAEDRGTTGTNTAYVFSNSWKQFNEISSLNTAFGFDILLCNFVGVNELKNKSFDFKIFPNPANNILNIVSSENQNLNVNIYNLLGKNVYSENSITPISKINISDLPNGMYIISVVSENSQISKRIVISR
ncbi:MAG: hypothetical protein A2046_05255, partial [Bacteroidetes bacterium GWA2_30_7]